jgi:thiosulfate dehydrogenase [quinone] large subunit
MFALLKGGKREQVSEHSTASSDTYSRLTTQPPFFSDTRMAWLWLVIRVYVGYYWFTAGWSKLTGYSLGIGSFGRPVPGGSWVSSTHHDVFLKGFISNAIAQAAGPVPQVQGWYAFFLQHVVLPYTNVFAYVVTFSEMLIGLGLLLGAFTGIAAFFGILMNLNYLLAGSILINPILGVLSLFLLLAWRISGFYGVDRYLLPLLGTPWTGSLVSNTREPASGYT